MIRALIFDFDGLILDTESAVYRSWQELYQAYGGHLDFSFWANIVGTVSNEGDYFDALEAQIGRPLERQSLGLKRYQRELELIASQPLQPGVEKYLQDARRLGLKIGLASSSTCAWVMGHLTQRGLIHYFDCLRARDDVHRVKPDPELYLSVLAGLGVQAEEAIALEDSPIGVTAAKAAGLFCVAVPNELTRRLSLEHADLRLNSLADLSLEALLRQVIEARNGRLNAKNHDSGAI